MNFNIIQQLIVITVITVTVFNPNSFKWYWSTANFRIWMSSVSYRIGLKCPSTEVGPVTPLSCQTKRLNISWRGKSKGLNLTGKKGGRLEAKRWCILGIKLQKDAKSFGILESDPPLDINNFIVWSHTLVWPLSS